MLKLYLCIRKDHLVRRCDDGSKQFRRDLTPGNIYTEEDIRRLNDVVLNWNVLVDPDAFEYLGGGPPNCDGIATVPELVEKGNKCLAWINGPVAQKLGWQFAAGSLLEPRRHTARDLVAPELRKLADAAVRLGRVDTLRTNPSNQIGAISVLNGILQWATEAGGTPEAGGIAQSSKDEADPYLPAETPKQCARRIKRHVTTLKRYIENGTMRRKIVGPRLWRLHQDDVRTLGGRLD